MILKSFKNSKLSPIFSIIRDVIIILTQIRCNLTLTHQITLFVFIHICTILFISCISSHPDILSLFTHFYFTAVYKPYAECFFVSVMMPQIDENLVFLNDFNIILQQCKASIELFPLSYPQKVKNANEYLKHITIYVI